MHAKHSIPGPWRCRSLEPANSKGCRDTRDAVTALQRSCPTTIPRYFEMRARDGIRQSEKCGTVQLVPSRFGEAAPVAASERTPKVGAKGTKRGRDESVISPESAAKQAKVKPPKLRLWDFMLPETWKRVHWQFYRSMGRKLEAPGSPWGYP